MAKKKRARRPAAFKEEEVNAGSILVFDFLNGLCSGLLCCGPFLLGLGGGYRVRPARTSRNLLVSWRRLEQRRIGFAAVDVGQPVCLFAKPGIAALRVNYYLQLIRIPLFVNGLDRPLIADGTGRDRRDRSRSLCRNAFYVLLAKVFGPCVPFRSRRPSQSSHPDPVSDTDTNTLSNRARDPHSSYDICITRSLHRGHDIHLHILACFIELCLDFADLFFVTLSRNLIGLQYFLGLDMSRGSEWCYNPDALVDSSVKDMCCLCMGVKEKALALERVHYRHAGPVGKERTEHPTCSTSHFLAKTAFAAAIQLACRTPDDPVAVGQCLNAFTDRIGRERRVFYAFVIAPCDPARHLRIGYHRRGRGCRWCLRPRNNSKRNKHQ